MTPTIFPRFGAPRQNLGIRRLSGQKKTKKGVNLKLGQKAHRQTPGSARGIVYSAEGLEAMTGSRP